MKKKKRRNRRIQISRLSKRIKFLILGVAKHVHGKKEQEEIVNFKFECVMKDSVVVA